MPARTDDRRSCPIDDLNDELVGRGAALHRKPDDDDQKRATTG
jgi:hypothetical protein